MTTGAARRPLRAGRVGRPHGLDGGFYVSDANPALLTRGQRLVLDDAAAVVVERKGTTQRPIVKLDRIADRAGAEGARGTRLLVRRDDAPELGPEEWWAEDLEDPNTFRFFECWESQETFDAHINSPHELAFGERYLPLITGETASQYSASPTAPQAGA